MSSDDAIINMYRSLLNTVHTQYSHTLNTLESIEQGMRDVLTRNYQHIDRHPVPEFRSPPTNYYQHFVDSDPIPTFPLSSQNTTRNSPFNNFTNDNNSSSRTNNTHNTSTNNLRNRADIDLNNLSHPVNNSDASTSRNVRSRTRNNTTSSTNTNTNTNPNTSSSVATSTVNPPLWGAESNRYLNN